MSIVFPRAAAFFLFATTVGVCAAGGASAGESPCPEDSTNCTTWSSPGAHEWTVPKDVRELHVTIAGAQGAGYYGGGGGYTNANLAVTPGQKLQLNVGGRGKWGGDGLSGGWGGGGEAADYAGSRGGGGGGASDIRTFSPYARDRWPLDNRVIVAGGGGGGGSGDGGFYTYAGGGGGGVNQNGTDGDGPEETMRPGARFAGGATLDRGGLGAIGYSRTGRGCRGFDGSDQNGLKKQNEGADGYSCYGTGGGGGGGYFGGGGGTQNNSGAGGSGYGSTAVTDIKAIVGAWTEQDKGNGGNGRITISW